MPRTARSPRPAPQSISVELLVHLAIMAAAALLFALVSIVVLVDVVEPRRLAIYLGALIAADVAVFVAFTALQLRRVVISPLHAAMAAAEAIAAGDLRRRVPDGETVELRNLAASVNRMTDRLLEERAQLVRAEKLASIGRLAAGVGHEIGNPLGAITGYAHVLRTRAAGRPELVEMVAGIERESGRIDRIVRGLLDYSRGRSPTPTPVDIAEVMRDIVDLLGAQGALKGVDVDVRAPSEPLRLHGQRHDLEQLFVNLLLNATAAMGGVGRISLSADRLWRGDLARPSVRRERADDDDVVVHQPSARARLWLAGVAAGEVAKIVVADSGPGVPPELEERIFDPFFTTKEPGQGTGLGLAIAARIVDNFQGTIWVTRAREGGAAFHMLFPVPSASGSDAVLPPARPALKVAR